MVLIRTVLLDLCAELWPQESTTNTKSTKYRFLAIHQFEIKLPSIFHLITIYKGTLDHLELTIKIRTT